MPNNFENGAGDNQDSNADSPWVRSIQEFGSDGQATEVEDGLKKHQLQEFGTDGQMVDVYDSVSPMQKHQLQEFGDDGKMVDVYDNVVPTETHQLQEFGDDGKMVDIVEPKMPLPEKDGDTSLGVDVEKGENSI